MPPPHQRCWDNPASAPRFPEQCRAPAGCCCFHSAPAGASPPGTALPLAQRTSDPPRASGMAPCVIYQVKNSEAKQEETTSDNVDKVQFKQRWLNRQHRVPLPQILEALSTQRARRIEHGSIRDAGREQRIAGEGGAGWGRPGAVVNEGP